MDPEDEPLNTDLMDEYAHEMTHELTRLLVSKPKSKERSSAAVIALAQVLVIVAIKLVGKEEAMEIISTAINRSFETTSPILDKLEAMRHAARTNPKAPGG